MQEIHFSPGTDCLNAINRTLRNARHTAKICVFTITDNRIVDAILEMQRNGVKVQIISDNDKRDDLGSDIGYLVRQGIEIKLDTTSAHMHHKFAVIDNETTITGSYNWTRSAETKNYENILITDNEYIAKTFLQEFDRLWDIMEPVYQ
ncbi:MAG: phospholipase D-like domain-containing protein [Bacteroidota bacterium]|nr:phospholipase D-like domain-containing protein [Bacteroidota bacterium]